MKQQTKKTSIQLLKYGLVGVSNSLITLIVIYVCNEIIGMKLMLADVIGYIAGLVNSFILNRNWVFKTHSRRLRYEMILFITGFLICFGIQFVSVLMLRNPMKSLDISVFNISSATIGEYIAVCAGMAIYTLSNYAYNRFVTFK